MQNKAIVEKLEPEEFNEFIDLMDLVFSKSAAPIDFMTLLPGIYHPTRECADSHWIVKSKGRMAASVGSIPADVMIGSHKIKLEGIGGVCTNKRDEGMGYMRAIMEAIRGHYEKDGVMLSYLTGERKRYQHYGYEKTGVAHEFIITEKNIKECSENAKRMSLTCEPLAKEDMQAISYAKKLHDLAPVHYDRRDEEHFYTKLTHWYNTPYIVRDSENNFAGYLVCGKDHKKIYEIAAETDDIFEALIKTWVEGKGETCLTLPPWRPSYIKRMLRICEGVSLHNSGQWLILDWVAVIGALLEVKASYSVLPDGCVSIEIKGFGVLTIRVKNNQPECAFTDLAPDIACDAFTAARLMCGHIAPVETMDLPPTLIPLFQSWFPLPLYCPSPDAV